jgi:hypothetical protein
MAMAQHRDVVEHVEVGAALHVDQVIAPAAFDARRVDVIVFLRAGETGVASGQQGVASSSASASQASPSSAAGEGHNACQAAAREGVQNNGASTMHHGSVARSTAR